jgi:uncharacterized protein (TIGR02996 family)
MTPRDALLQTIRDNPADEAALLVYADCLEEDGPDPRAELIRVQCALERLPATAPQRFELQRREEGLRRHYVTTFLRQYRRVLKSWRFRRGVLDDIALTVADFLVHADAVLHLAPLAEVRFHSTRGQLGRLAGSPHLAQLSRINLSYSFLTDAGVVDLARSAHLGGLRVLRLAHNSIRFQGAEALATCEGLAGLRVLDVSGNLLGNAGLQALRARFGDRLVC